MNLVVRGTRRGVLIAAGFILPGVFLTIQAPAASGAGTPPTVEFLVAPAPGAIVHYSVQFAWQGADEDGTVSLYRIAIDPPEFGEPFWIETTNTVRTVFFATGSPDLPIPATGPVTFSQPHTLVIKAVDNEGLESDPVSRSFVASTVAPEVQIDAPTPDPAAPVPIGTEVTIDWHGTDSDGVFSQRPVRYKWLLMGPGTDYPGGIDAAWANPEAFREHYAPLFPGWEANSGDTTSVQFVNFIPGMRLLFCVIGIDEAGAYSARFERGINMVQFLVGTTPVEPETWGRLKRRFR